MDIESRIGKGAASTERLKCPICGKRAADILSGGDVELELKCPHCHRLVKVKYAGRRIARRRVAV